MWPSKQSPIPENHDELPQNPDRDGTVCRVDRPGMIPAVETLLCTPAVRNLIREARTFEIPNVIETSRAIGMCSLDSSIAELYFNGYISREDAIAQAAFPDKLVRQLAA